VHAYEPKGREFESQYPVRRQNASFPNRFRQQMGKRTFAVMEIPRIFARWRKHSRIYSLAQPSGRLCRPSWRIGALWWS